MTKKTNNIRTLVEESVGRTPDKTFFIFKDEEIAYQEFLKSINRVANGFISLGVKKGDKVAILLANCVEFPYSWLAANMIGAILVPVNTSFVDKEIEYVLNHSEAKLLVTSESYLERIEGIRRNIPFIESVIDISASNRSKTIPFSSLLKNPSHLKQINISGEDIATIGYTSGTTGNPKGCVKTHESVVHFADTEGKLFQLSSEDRIITAQPFHYGDPRMFTLMAMMYNATIVLLERFSSSKFWDQVRQYNITRFFLAGAMTSFLYNVPPSDLDKQHKVKFVQCNGIPPNIHKAWEERFNVPVFEVYGSTETGNDIAVMHGMDRKVGTACIGRPVYYRKAKIVGENDAELPPGEIGEIILKRGKEMMKEYYKDPEATARAFRGGWFRTGDLAYKDEDGDFHFVGRKKDIIRRGGENISASSVEHVLLAHPKIADAAAIAVPDKIRGEEVKVYIVLREGQNMTYEEIIKFCEEHMAAFKVPRYIEFKDSLPKTPTDRVQKRKLIEERSDLTEGCYDRLATGSKGL